MNHPEIFSGDSAEKRVGAVACPIASNLFNKGAILLQMPDLLSGTQRTR